MKRIERDKNKSVVFYFSHWDKKDVEVRFSEQAVFEIINAYWQVEHNVTSGILFKNGTCLVKKDELKKC